MSEEQITALVAKHRLRFADAAVLTKLKAFARDIEEQARMDVYVEIGETLMVAARRSAGRVAA